MEEIERVNFLSDIALELSGCGYWHVDYSDPEYYYQSERAARILGEPLKEDGRYHLQDEWFSRLEEANPETAELTDERYQGAIEGRYDSYDSTYAYKRPLDGEIVWVHASGQVMRDDDGKIQFMYGVYQDVTQRKQAEQTLSDALENAEQYAAELQSSRMLIQGLLDATDAVIYVKDLDGRYMLVNKEWVRVVGRGAEETIGQTDFDFQPPEVAQALVDNDQQVIQRRKTHPF